MTSIVDDCTHHYLLPDGQSTLYDTLPSFDEDLGGDVTAEELSLPPVLEAIDETQTGASSSLPATPAERPCTFCPSALPLPPASCQERATLVLDLDGTLIASEELNSANSAYLWNPHAGSRAPDYEAMGRRVWLRPGVRDFLAAVRPHFEIVLFTAATQNWASAAVEQLDPAAELFDVMLHRDHTTSDLMWDYVKDLSRLGRDLARTVIVDDNPLMFMYQPDNALHVAAYEAATAGGADNVLERVSELLITQVAPAEDVREILGPMASAKACILSTVASTMGAPVEAAASAAVSSGSVQGEQLSTVASAAIEIAASIADGAAEAARLDSSASGQHTALVDSSGTDGSYEAASVDETESRDERVSCDSGVVSGGRLSEEEGHAGPLCLKPGQAADPLHQRQDEDGGDTQQRQDGNGDDISGQAAVTIGGGCGSCTAAAAWDAEDAEEGAAEAFDANGATAQLGAEDGPACYRHRDWDEEAAQHTAADRDVGAGADVASGRQSGSGSEESDAGPGDETAEEPTEHSSEDFEALMEDAIAEYDSDAYEERYDKDLGYDGVCPAATAVTTGCGPFATAEDPCAAFGRLSSRHGSGCYDPGVGRYRCGGFASGFCEQLADEGHGVVIGPGTGSATLAEPVAFNVFQGVVECDETTASASADAGQAGVAGAVVMTDPTTAFPVPGSLEAMRAMDSLTCGNEAAGVLPRPASGLELSPLQSRPSSLPTGMVFLTDLNPSLRCGSLAAEPDQPAPVACAAEKDACAVVAAVEVAWRGTASVSCCKRLHEDDGCSPDADREGQESGEAEDGYGAPRYHRRARVEL